MLGATIAATISGVGATPPPDESGSQPAFVARPIVVVQTYKGRTAQQWESRYRKRTRQLQGVRARLHTRWQPTVLYALRLAAAVTGVPYSELWTVSRCESGHSPFATNGQYKGLFQIHWAPFGFSPFDPVANALSAALTVRHDGGWRQWSCRP